MTWTDDELRDPNYHIKTWGAAYRLKPAYHQWLRAREKLLGVQSDAGLDSIPRTQKASDRPRRGW